MATKSKKSATRKSAPAKAVKRPAKKRRKKPQKLFTQQEIQLVDSTLRPAVGDTLTDKVISVLQDAVGTPPVI